MPLADSYLDRTELKVVGILPESLVEGTFLSAGTQQAAWQAFVDAQLIAYTAEINAILSKRYATPFQAPVPNVIRNWLARLVTGALYERRGWDPSDAQATALYAHIERIWAALRDAADSEIGLRELPLRQNTTADGVSKGMPFGYSEASPYSWVDAQAEILRGGGT